MESQKQGLDLEKELTCSICTELLYQPLTLLDCLHTFCGACLKEWFTFQATAAERAPDPPTSRSRIFTCPSCRATVRDTRPNATFVTLLEMYMTANPDKARSTQEIQEMQAKYKPGDQIFPKVKLRSRNAEERRAEEEDRRLVNRVREMSLQDGGASSSRTRRRGESRSGDERSRATRDRSLDSRARRRHRYLQEDEGGRASSDHASTDGERRRRRRSESRPRQIEHQSSIRSLIGSSEMSERDIEREIEDFARQIQEEGLLDGLDLDNIDLARDDELSRRITEAYRRRQRERNRPQSSRRDNGRSSNGRSRPSESRNGDSRRLAPEGHSRAQSRTRPHSRSASATSQSDERTGPPTSMVAMNLDVHDQGRRPRRRTASGSRSSTTPIFPTIPSEARPAARSQTDLSLRTQSIDATVPRPSITEGRSTSSPVVNTTPQPSTELPGSLSFANRLPGGVPSPLATSLQTSSTSADPRPRRPSELAIVHSSVTSPTSGNPGGAGHQRTRSQLYPEPSISCARCGKNHIEYDLHYNCSICSNGQWNTCHDCYRRGKGCLYWFGFGYGAWLKWEKARQGDESLAKPHMLMASRYKPPQSTPGGANGRKTLTTDDPRRRLESGTFCAKCSAWTNDCYWRCDVCNEGEWGYCNDCVNQGRCCTHMLLPLSHETTQSSLGRPGSPPRSPGRPSTATILTGPQASSIGPFKPLTFATRCDICHDPIAPTQARYHCFSCTSSLVAEAAPGDYDICSSCYGKSVEEGQISDENGHGGWRRCLRGHRMVIVAFSDGKVGQWRYVAQDLVGGLGLRCKAYDGSEHEGQDLEEWQWGHGDEVTKRLVTKDVSATAPEGDDTEGFAHSFPPDGGTGFKAIARWAWYPQEGVDDELLFPRGAEMKEIEDVSEEWFFGAYMGSRGLFPAPYVRRDQTSS